MIAAGMTGARDALDQLTNDGLILVANYVLGRAQAKQQLFAAVERARIVADAGASKLQPVEPERYLGGRKHDYVYPLGPRGGGSKHARDGLAKPVFRGSLIWALH